MYREHLMDHFKSPRNYGVLPEHNCSRHEKNPSCGDDVTFQLLIEDNRIKDVKFEGSGCAISLASSSMLTEELIGATVEEIIQMPRDEMLEIIGIPLSTMRVKCGLLGLHTIKKALGEYLGKKNDGEW